METFFNIRYEFDKTQVHAQIDAHLKKQGSDYICVADGVIANQVQRHQDYREVVNGGMFSICDSSFIPLYIRLIYGKRYSQYCGSDIFEDIVRCRKYRMIFLGSNQKVLEGLKEKIKDWNPDVVNMTFKELPYCDVNSFEYIEIARSIEEDNAEIIWVSLGAPKQEYFMSLLKPHLKHGVMIAVGAAFKFYSGGVDVKRAPKWMIRHHLEFIHRIIKEPKKQIPRCFRIIKTLPKQIIMEWLNSHHAH